MMMIIIIIIIIIITTTTTGLYSMRSNTSHSETGKFEDVYIMIRNTEFNWEWSLIKMTTN